MQVIPKKWGYEKIIADTEFYLGKILVVYKGDHTSMHRHFEKDEVIYVHEGTLIYSWLDVLGQFEFEFVYEKGTSVRVKPGTWHRLSSTEKSHVILIETSTPFPDDSQRFDDRFDDRLKDDKVSKNKS